MNKTQLQEIKDLLNNSNSIVILTHNYPDGDAIGSSMALYHLLINLNKNVNVVTPNDPPEFLKWISNYKKIIIFDKNETETSNLILNADLIFNLDFNYTDRVGNAEIALKESKAKKVLIDHHPNPDDFADITISDTSVSSTAELIYEFIEQMDYKEFIDREVAECLMMGIMTDTISFTVNCSRSRTFFIVAELLNYGIDKNQIYSNIFDNFTSSRMRLLGYCLDRKMVVLKQYNTAYIALSRQELKDFHFRKGDSEGFVNYPLSIKKVNLSVLFIEKPNQIKLSFRSKNNLAVNVFAEKYFNGGGHKNAAGGEMNLPLDKTIEYFLRLLPELKNL